MYVQEDCAQLGCFVAAWRQAQIRAAPSQRSLGQINGLARQRTGFAICRFRFIAGKRLSRVRYTNELFSHRLRNRERFYSNEPRLTRGIERNSGEIQKKVFCGVQILACALEIWRQHRDSAKSGGRRRV